jgi:hypothetical protein
VIFLKPWISNQLVSHVPITPTFLSGCSREIVGDYAEEQTSAHHFSRYCSWTQMPMGGV